jgi:ubiquinone/menaquinone biosynthesis C-methylase UbiE
MKLKNLNSIISLIKSYVFRKEVRKNTLLYWKSRVNQFGDHAVLNLNYQNTNIDFVTDQQIKFIFPILENKLNGNERLLLDYGCGIGRFTPYLAKLINGKAIGIDPIEELIAAAPEGENIEFKVSDPSCIPYPVEYFDIIWICLVMGGIINKKMLKVTIDEIQRVLKPNGLLFLIENTSQIRNSDHWHYRTQLQYQNLFQFCNLNIVGSYQELDEYITIFSGRKQIFSN